MPATAEALARFGSSADPPGPAAPGASTAPAGDDARPDATATAAEAEAALSAADRPASADAAAAGDARMGGGAAHNAAVASWMRAALGSASAHGQAAQPAAPPPQQQPVHADLAPGAHLQQPDARFGAAAGGFLPPAAAAAAAAALGALFPGATLPPQPAQHPSREAAGGSGRGPWHRVALQEAGPDADYVLGGWYCRQMLKCSFFGQCMRSCWRDLGAPAWCRALANCRDHGTPHHHHHPPPTHLQAHAHTGLPRPTNSSPALPCPACSRAAVCPGGGAAAPPAEARAAGGGARHKRPQVGAARPSHQPRTSGHHLAHPVCHERRSPPKSCFTTARLAACHAVTSLPHVPPLCPPCPASPSRYFGVDNVRQAVRRINKMAQRELQVSFNRDPCCPLHTARIERAWPQLAAPLPRRPVSRGSSLCGGRGRRGHAGGPPVVPTAALPSSLCCTWRHAPSGDVPARLRRALLLQQQPLAAEEADRGGQHAATRRPRPPRARGLAAAPAGAGPRGAGAGGARARGRRRRPFAAPPQEEGRPRARLGRLPGDLPPCPASRLPVVLLRDSRFRAAYQHARCSWAVRWARCESARPVQHAPWPAPPRPCRLTPATPRTRCFRCWAATAEAAAASAFFLLSLGGQHKDMGTAAPSHMPAACPQPRPHIRIPASISGYLPPPEQPPHLPARPPTLNPNSNRLQL